MLREMTHSEGGFYSTQDADSEGHEGKFSVWDQSEIKSLLGEEDAAIFNAFYDITEAGNFEGKNIPNIKQPLKDVSKQLGIEEHALVSSLQKSKTKLFATRDRELSLDRD